MKGKSILILVMSCNIDRYLSEEENIRLTWGKYCDGDEVKLLFYRGGYGENKINGDVLELSSNDNLEGTYKKTIDAIGYINNNINYDYLIRTNTTTYLNINLIKDFINTYIEDDKIYGGDVCVNFQSGFIPYFRGNFLLCSKNIINDIILAYDKRFYGVDDVFIGITLYKYYLNNNRYYINNMRQLPHITNYQDNKEFIKKDKIAYFIRFKDEYNSSMNITRCLELHNKYQSIKQQLINADSVSYVETLGGVLQIKDSLINGSEE